jgi:rhodanese-related sulfurtransferase
VNSLPSGDLADLFSVNPADRYPVRDRHRDITRALRIFPGVSMKTALFALLFAVSGVAAAADFGHISTKELDAAIKAKSQPVVVIDVNGTDAYKTGHIPTAIDFEAKEKELAKMLPADKSTLVVAYCGNAQCPAWKSAAKAVAALGYTNVKHLEGGIAGWKAEGGQLAKPN